MRASRLPALAVAAAALVTGCAGHTPTRVLSSPTSPSTQPAAEPVDPLSPQPAVESAAPSAAGVPACSGDRLSVTDADLVTDPQHLQEVFAVRSTGATCVLRGWPDVSLLDAGGTPIRVTARRTGAATALTITRTTSLSFVLTTPRTSDCQDVATVVVRLPGTARALRATTGMQVCHGTVQVGPVERRQDHD